MKGQFFMLGAILLASMFFIALPMTGYVIKTVSEDLDYISDNIENEFPRALNLIADSDIERLKDFSVFVDNQITQRSADFKNLWVVTKPEGGDVNITVGNFLDEDINIALNVSNTIEIMFMPSGTTNSVMFYNVPSQFVLRVTFPGIDKELKFQRDKINLYSFFSISRGENIVKKEMVA